MRALDWRRVADYAYADELSAPQWAWEFLRRNPEYRREYQVFIRVWRDLETAYGVPPERDFQAWKNDSRAYVLMGDAGSEGCRVDEDKVLIECALGAKWGFYQFPKDPDIAAPDLELPPVWREVANEVPVLDAVDVKYLGVDPSCVALGFDLSLPLGEQLERARLKLGALKSARRRAGHVWPRSIRALRSQWVLYLRMLDARLAGVMSADLPPELCVLGEEARAEMLYLCAEGYRNVASLPEGDNVSVDE